jgi:hypothetical protein
MAHSILIQNLDDHAVTRLQEGSKERGLSAGEYISRLVELGDWLRIHAQSPLDTDTKRLSIQALEAAGLL